jgi:hypothetical protein
MSCCRLLIWRLCHLASVVQLNSPIPQIHTDSCSFNVDEDVTEISSVDVDESVVALGATEISTSRPSDDENSVSDREAENEGSVVGAAATAKLPLASKLMYATTTTALERHRLAFEESIQFCAENTSMTGKIISNLKPQNVAKLQQ